MFCKSKNNNLHKLLALGLVIVLLLAGLIVPAASAVADWPQFQKDTINSGVTDNSTDTGPISGSASINWSAPLSQYHDPWWGDYGVDAAPIVAEVDGHDVVFTLCAEGNVWANYADNGTEKWHRNDLGYGTFRFELSTPAYGDNKIFVAQNDGKVWALHADNGTNAWGVGYNEISSSQLNTPVLYNSDGYIYCGDMSSKYYCLNASDGSLEWTFTGGGGYYWAGACLIQDPTDTMDHLVFGSEDGYLYSVNATGNPSSFSTYVNRIELNHLTQIRSSVTWDAGNNRVYTTAKDGYLYGVPFDPSDGTFGDTLTMAKNLNSGQSTSTPVLHDGKIYVGTGSAFSNGALHCVEVSSNTTLWSYTDNGTGGALRGVQSSPVVYDTGSNVYVYFTTNCNTGGAYCVSDNQTIWYVQPHANSEQGTDKAFILQGVAINDGMVFFGNDGGYLYAIKDP